MKKGNHNVLLAIPKAVIRTAELNSYSAKGNRIYNFVLSKPLGFFLVKPVKRLKVYRDADAGTMFNFSIVGFVEARTGKRIITRTFQEDGMGSYKVIQHDVMAGTIPVDGDVFWHVEECPSDDLDLSKINAYMKLSKNEIINRLSDVHEKAREMVLQVKDVNEKQKIKTNS